MMQLTLSGWIAGGSAGGIDPPTPFQIHADGSATLGILLAQRQLLAGEGDAHGPSAARIRRCGKALARLGGILYSPCKAWRGYPTSRDMTDRGRDMAKYRRGPRTYTFDKGNGELYSGSTNDLDRRLNEHRQEYPNLRLLWSKSHPSMKAAREHEKILLMRREAEERNRRKPAVRRRR